MGQRLQRQGNAWRQELACRIRYPQMTPVEEARATLGCTLLIKLCDLLHARMFQSNSESLAIGPSTVVPPRGGGDCSLLLSVTDSDLPLQPGSPTRYWFPKERQFRQPQTENAILEVQHSASSLPLPKSADLEALLATRSFDELKEQCKELRCVPAKKKLNRLQMAQSILFAQAATSASKSRKQTVRQPRQQPASERQGKVLSFNSWFVVWSQC